MALLDIQAMDITRGEGGGGGCGSTLSVALCEAGSTFSILLCG